MTEQEYTQSIVIPLLKYLGFVEVTYTHGIEEFGKDVLFSEYDRFGNKIYHAAQVKVGDISGGNNGIISDLINHIGKAFNMDFPDLITKEEVGISHFFVISSGRFVGNAPKLLLGYKSLLPYRHRLHFYEGHHIQALFERSLRDIKELCVATLNEIQYNSRQVLAGQKLLATGGTLYAGYTTASLSQLITKLALLQEREPLTIALRDYQVLVSRNNNLIAWIPLLRPIRGAEDETRALRNGLDAMLTRGAQLSDTIKQTLADLQP